MNRIRASLINVKRITKKEKSKNEHHNPSSKRLQHSNKRNFWRMGRFRACTGNCGGCGRRGCSSSPGLLEIRPSSHQETIQLRASLTRKRLAVVVALVLATSATGVVSAIAAESPAGPSRNGGTFATARDFSQIRQTSVKKICPEENSDLLECAFEFTFSGTMYRPDASIVEGESVTKRFAMLATIYMNDGGRYTMPILVGDVGIPRVTVPFRYFAQNAFLDAAGTEPDFNKGFIYEQVDGWSPEAPYTFNRCMPDSSKPASLADNVRPNVVTASSSQYYWFCNHINFGRDTEQWGGELASTEVPLRRASSTDVAMMTFDVVETYEGVSTWVTPNTAMANGVRNLFFAKEDYEVPNEPEKNCSDSPSTTNLRNTPGLGKNQYSTFQLPTLSKLLKPSYYRVLTYISPHVPIPENSCYKTNDARFKTQKSVPNGPSGHTKLEEGPVQEIVGTPPLTPNPVEGGGGSTPEPSTPPETTPGGGIRGDNSIGDFFPKDPDKPSTIIGCVNFEWLNFKFDVPCLLTLLFVPSPGATGAIDGAIDSLFERAPFGYATVMFDSAGQLLSTNGATCQELRIPVLGANMLVWPCLEEFRAVFRPITTWVFTVGIAIAIGSWIYRRFQPSFD